MLYRSTSLLALRNQAHAINSLPGAPSGLHAFVAGNLVTLFWNDALDANQTAALTYNVRVGTAPGRNDVVPSMSTTNGVRMIRSAVTQSEIWCDTDRAATALTYRTFCCPDAMDRSFL